MVTEAVAHIQDAADADGSTNENQYAAKVSFLKGNDTHN